MRDEDVVIFFYEEIKSRLEEFFLYEKNNLMNDEEIEVGGLSKEHKREFWINKKNEIIQREKSYNPLIKFSKLNKDEFISEYNSELSKSDLIAKYNHPVWRQEYINDRAHYYLTAEIIQFINSKIAFHESDFGDEDDYYIKTTNIDIQEDIRASLFDALKLFFDKESHQTLQNLLNGQSSSQKILFKSTAIRFIGVFWQLHSHNLIVQDKMETAQWISDHFLYLNNKSKRSQVFKYSYCKHRLELFDRPVAKSNSIKINNL